MKPSQELAFFLIADPITYANQMRAVLTIQATVQATKAAQSYIHRLAQHDLRRLEQQARQRKGR
jgi:hypothetical protein